MLQNFCWKAWNFWPNFQKNCKLARQMKNNFVFAFVINANVNLCNGLFRKLHIWNFSMWATRFSVGLIGNKGIIFWKVAFSFILCANGNFYQKLWMHFEILCKVFCKMLFIAWANSCNLSSAIFSNFMLTLKLCC